MAAFASLVLLGWGRRLDRVRRAKIAACGAAGIAITVFTSLILPRLVSPRVTSAARDWSPSLFLLLFYWQAGQFVTRADVQIEAWLEGLDEKLVAPFLQWCSRRRLRVWILESLELAYLSYYFSIPLAVGALYWFGKRSQADYFWTAVLLAAYGSCGMLALLQLRPPRMIGEKWTACLPSGKVRALNLWVLRRGSIQANTTPSAHVAIATAGALALLKIGPRWIGLSFLGMAVGIALGAVAGRYHYGLDAILGFGFGAAALLGAAALAGCGLVG